MLATWMMRPRFAGSIDGRKARETRNGPRRFTATTSSHAAGSVPWTRGPRRSRPARRGDARERRVAVRARLGEAPGEGERLDERARLALAARDEARVREDELAEGAAGADLADEQLRHGVPDALLEREPPR